MKKIAFLALAIAALFVFASTALAGVSIDIDKDTRVLTITSDDDNQYEINVNGADEYVLGLASAGSVSRTLSKDGDYSVKVYDMTNLKFAASKTFTLGEKATEAPTTAPTPTAEPTAVPTAEPTAVPTEVPTEAPTAAPDEKLSISAPTYKNGAISFVASGVKAPCEVYIDGSFAGVAVSSNGSKSIKVELPIGNHSLYLFCPDTLEKSAVASFEVKYLKPVVSNASYKDGKITFTVSNNDTYCEVYVDGAFTGFGINGEGTKTITKALDCKNPHSLYLFNADGVLKSDPVTFEAHKFVTVPAVDPTCTEAGKTAEVKCEVCGKVTTPAEAIPALGHKTEKIPAVEATCTEKGKTEGEKCTVCGEIVKAQEEVPALGHDLWAIEIKPTCTEGGKMGDECVRCGEEFDVKDLAPLGHDFGEWTVVKAATCTADGEEARACKREDCDEKETRVVAKTGHTPEAIPAVAATCIAAGKTAGEKCSVCGEILKAQEDVKALGHNYIIIERSAEKVTYQCTRCGDSFIEKLAAADQKNGYGSIVKDANLVEVDYTANANKLDQKCLVIVADLSKAGLTTELGLYLDDALIAQLIKEGYETVNFVNGEASIVITLKEISPAWFSTSNAIWAYVFSTDPAAEGGTLVKVEALISASEKVAADAFSGVVLKTVNGDLAVTANGIY